MSKESKSKYSTIAMYLGMLAFGVAIWHFLLGPIEEPLKIEGNIAEKAAAICADGEPLMMEGEL